MINHEHTSGRFNASAVALENSLDFHMKWAEAMTLTEVAARPRADAVKEKGWAVVQAKAGTRAADCALVFKKDKFKVLKEDFPELSDATYMNKRGFQTRPIHAVIGAVEDDKTKEVGVWSTAHLPSAVRTAKGFRKTTSQYRAYIKNARAQKKAVNLFIDELNGDGIKVDYIIISNDWNIDYKRLWTRTFLKRLYPKFHANWKKPYPKNGSFEQSLIDITLMHGATVVGRPAILEDGSTDHNSVKQVLKTK